MTKYNGPTNLVKNYSQDDLLLATQLVREERKGGMNMTMINAHFFGVPGDDLNLETKASKRLYRTCEKIFENHNGNWFAEETCMINCEQTLMYNVPTKQPKTS